MILKIKRKETQKNVMKKKIVKKFILYAYATSNRFFIDSRIKELMLVP